MSTEKEKRLKEKVKTLKGKNIKLLDLLFEGRNEIRELKKEIMVLKDLNYKLKNSTKIEKGVEDMTKCKHKEKILLRRDKNVKVACGKCNKVLGYVSHEVALDMRKNGQAI